MNRSTGQQVCFERKSPPLRFGPLPGPQNDFSYTQDLQSVVQFFNLDRIGQHLGAGGTLHSGDPSWIFVFFHDNARYFN